MVLFLESMLFKKKHIFWQILNIGKKGVKLQFQLLEVLTTLTIKTEHKHMKSHRCSLANETKLADHSTSVEGLLQEAKQNPYLRSCRHYIYRHSSI